MAVAQMKKLSVAVLQKDAQRLIADLQKLRCVEVSGDFLPGAEADKLPGARHRRVSGNGNAYVPNCFCAAGD